MRLKYTVKHPTARFHIRDLVWGKILHLNYDNCSGRPRVKIRSYVQWRTERPVLIMAQYAKSFINEEVES